MVGLKLKAELDKRGMKYSFVSKKTGIPYMTLSQYLNGHRPLPHPRLLAICKVADIDEKIFEQDDLNLVHREAS